MLPTRSFVQRLILIPDWLHTRTGQAAVIFGAALVIVKALSIADVGFNLPLQAALSVISFGAAVLALTSIVPLARDATAERRWRLPWRLLAVAMALPALGALIHVLTSTSARS